MFAGIFTRDTSSPAHYSDKNTLLAAITPYQQADQAGVWMNQSYLIVHALTRNTLESEQETTPWQCPQSKLVIASWVRLDNREELARQLRITTLTDITDPMLIIAAYRKWGKGCSERLEGDFSFVIYDPQHNACFSARDSLGVKPFYYFLDEKVFIFATTATIFPRLRNFHLQINTEWMSRFLIGDSMSHTKTGYHDVFKLPAAHCLNVSSSDKNFQRYHEFKDDAPKIYKRNEKWVSAYRGQLELAVEKCLRSDYHIGSESSGGLDSSTITTIAAEKLKPEIENFHIFGFARMSLEPEFIQETSRAAGIVNNHIISEIGYEDTTAANLRALTATGYPIEHRTATYHIPFYQHCEDLGIRSLLSGFGGDEVVTNPGHLLMSELLDEKQYLALYRELTGNPLRRTARLLKRILSNQKAAHFHPVFYQAYAQRWEHTIASEATNQQYNLKQRFMRLARFDAPYRSINQFILGNRMAAYVPTRLENCTLVAATYKLEYRWPLLNRQLMQQYMSTPSIEKWHHSADRYLHRRAMHRVPDKIRWKANKDMGESAAYDRSLPILTEQFFHNIHPALQSLVNIEKLKQQQSMLRSVNHTPLSGQQNLRVIRQLENNDAMRLLNQWLLKFF